MRRLLLAISVVLSLAAGAASAGGLQVVARDPARLQAHLADAVANSLSLYRVTYQDGTHTFVWDNLTPDAAGNVTLADDLHLRPEYRLRCESRTSAQDPVIFDDFTKGALSGRKRLPFGVPVSTFGGPGFLVPGVSSLVRDVHGGFWLYLDHPPYALLRYDRALHYQPPALLLPDRALALDTDADGNLWVLHTGNWISKHGPLGQTLNAWELPFGRDPGEFSLASGMAIDRENEALYLSDEVLGRVQRFDMNLKLQPIVSVAWGWFGREDLAYTRAGQYDPDTMYYQLDRPKELRLDGKGHLLVGCEHYLTQFDLGTGKQVPFGANAVLGWGGTFSDSAFSSTAGTDGHWERFYLAGVDGAGRLYVADRDNEFAPEQRLQVFAPDGGLQQVFSVARELKDAKGQRVFLTAVAQLAGAGEDLWLTDAGGRIYASHGGLRDGGELSLGPGAAGRQFDLSAVDESKFTVEAQPARVRHTYEGKVLGFSGDEPRTANCERGGDPMLKVGDRSMWLLARLGEPFTLTLLQPDGTPIPESKYVVEYEDHPGAFGTLYDFFRVTNLSGEEWNGVKYRVEAKE